MRILIIAGPNGAGKTTFAREYLLKELGIERFVNADLIAAGLSPFNPDLAQLAAGRIMLQEIDNFVKLRKNFAFESTLAGLAYARRIRQWRKIGYHVSITFLSLPSSAVAIQRVKNRVNQGGHDIPEDVIKRRFLSGLTNFSDIYKNIVDDWDLLDNTKPIPTLTDWKESDDD